jgi:hypothetical protein
MNLEDLITKGLAKVSCPGHEWNSCYISESTVYKCHHCGRAGIWVSDVPGPGYIVLSDEIIKKSNTHTWAKIKNKHPPNNYNCSVCGTIGYFCIDNLSILTYHNYTCNEFILKAVIE